MNSKSLDRRGFLGGVLKLGAGAAALTLVPGCEALQDDDHGKRGRGRRACGSKRNAKQYEKTDRVAEPVELFAPLTMGMVMEDKWRLDAITRRPDSHLRVRLVDTHTNNPLDVELFRGPDAKKRSIAQTDHWEFYTYNEKEAGKSTPDHVKDAINQLAAMIIDTEPEPAIINLNATVCTFAQRKHDEPVGKQTAPAAGRTEPAEPATGS